MSETICGECTNQNPDIASLILAMLAAAAYMVGLVERAGEFPGEKSS